MAADLPPFPLDPNALSEWIERLVDAKVAAALARMPNPGPESTSKYLTVPEACDLMRAPRQRIYDLLYNGQLTPYGTKGARLLLREEVEAHLRGADTGPTGEAVRRARAPRAA